MKFYDFTHFSNYILKNIFFGRNLENFKAYKFKSDFNIIIKFFIRISTTKKFDSSFSDGFFFFSQFYFLRKKTVILSFFQLF